MKKVVLDAGLDNLPKGIYCDGRGQVFDWSPPVFRLALATLWFNWMEAAKLGDGLNAPFVACADPFASPPAETTAPSFVEALTEARLEGQAAERLKRERDKKTVEIRDRLLSAARAGYRVPEWLLPNDRLHKLALDDLGIRDCRAPHGPDGLSAPFWERITDHGKRTSGPLIRVTLWDEDEP